MSIHCQLGLGQSYGRAFSLLILKQMFYFSVWLFITVIFICFGWVATTFAKVYMSELISCMIEQ